MGFLEELPCTEVSQGCKIYIGCISVSKNTSRVLLRIYGNYLI